MAHLKVLSPARREEFSDILGPLPTEKEVEADRIQDPTEAMALLVLKKRVQEEVRTATENNIVLPPTLLDQVADHMLNLSMDEPCGLRGSVIMVVYADPELGEHKLVEVKADVNKPDTHLLILRLHADPASWYTKMARIFRSLGGKRRMIVSPKYDLLKQTFHQYAR